MTTHVRDEKGIAHTHCHGVPAGVWFTFVREARIILSDGERRAAQGFVRLMLDSSVSCSDPDCKRLNRISGDSSRPAYANFRLVRDIEPVHPADPEDRDVKICEGHPWKAGSLLCSACARVALAKRLINNDRAAGSLPPDGGTALKNEQRRRLRRRISKGVITAYDEMIANGRGSADAVGEIVAALLSLSIFVFRKSSEASKAEFMEYIGTVYDEEG